MTTSRVVVALAALLLAACASKPDTDSAPPDDAAEGEGRLFSASREYNRSALEIPPDLLRSAGQRVQANAAAAGADGAAGERVLPPVIGAAIQTDGEKSWLEIDADAEVVWHKLAEFWALQEIELVDYRPQAGIMETDWFSRKTDRAGQGLGSVAVELLSALVSRRTAVDKFILRLARDDGDGAARTKIFVTHRAREKLAQELDDIDKTVEFNWVERDEDEEKIAQLLQTVVLLFDARADESTETAAGDSDADAGDDSIDDSTETAVGDSDGDAGDDAGDDSGDESIDDSAEESVEENADEAADADAEAPA